MKISTLLVSLTLLTGCGTAPTEPQVQLTPLESCLKEAKRTAGICVLGALGSGQTFNDATAQRNVRICEDRQLVHEDRCYARFK